MTQMGVYASGLRNEHKLVDAIQQICGPFTVKFISETKTVEYKNIIEVSHAGRTLRDGSKSDIILHSITDDYRISIKQDNSMTWESADRMYNSMLVDIVNECIVNGDVCLEEYEGVHRLNKPIIVNMSESNKIKAVFGNDILEHGIVVFRTFQKEDFVYDKTTHTINVTVSDIYNNINDINVTIHEPYLMIRNDKTRVYSPITGLRLVSVAKNRICGNYYFLDKIA